MSGIDSLARIAICALRRITTEQMRAYLYSRGAQIYHFGFSIRCPFCNGRFRSLITFGMSKRPVLCPVCGSIDRERQIYLFLRHANLFSSALRMLHFAPEKNLAAVMRRSHCIDYYPVDLGSPGADTYTDITAICFREDTFDVVLCSHVLEHVEDDKKAISELFRVLKPGGKAYIIVPIDHALTETVEDLSIKDPEQRLKLYGQQDHVRRYGTDFAKRLEASGFCVSAHKFSHTFNGEQAKNYALLSKEDIYQCLKPITSSACL